MYAIEEYSAVEIYKELIISHILIQFVREPYAAISYCFATNGGKFAGHSTVHFSKQELAEWGDDDNVLVRLVMDKAEVKKKKEEPVPGDPDE